MPTDATEIIVTETIHLTKEQADYLDKTASAIEKATGFKPNRSTVIRSMIMAFSLLKLDLKNVSSEKDLFKAIKSSLKL